VEVKLTKGAWAEKYGTDNFEAWSHCTKGLSIINRMTKTDLFKARNHYERAINLDHNWATAWVLLAWTYINEVKLGWSSSPAESIKQSLDLTHRAAALSVNQADIHSLKAEIFRLQGCLSGKPVLLKFFPAAVSLLIGSRGN
jgi:hypothetical protein